ncbi:hypothetical protein CK203_100990 [Vitis vinifera]|uniref:Fungal lipase-type domain-containing protein n=1 Tax=Vitis vinifera TaxID=29760 RepID=A0A438DG20_VITVI|nr:hypothetical protein CK203_100990 [Vitis vinifera]
MKLLLGFLARAKGIPALELYRLAQKKKRKLVLCGHSLGGAVAALATLAILRVISASSLSKENEKVAVKCITFSQPPVGNAALKDYVNRKGWHHYFKTYCIPEDLVPRILGKLRADKPKENEGEQLVLGLGPVQSSFWRLSRLVPLESVKRQLSKYRGKQVDPIETSLNDSALASSIDDMVVEPQSLEIQEGSDGISLKPFSDMDKGDVATTKKLEGKSNSDRVNNRAWRRVPYLPSYVPFGQVGLRHVSYCAFLAAPQLKNAWAIFSLACYPGSSSALTSLRLTALA